MKRSDGKREKELVGLVFRQVPSDSSTPSHGVTNVPLLLLISIEVEWRRKKVYGGRK